MKFVLTLNILLLIALLSGASVAQQHYSFEEACRRAGWTTGPCAPKSQQEQSLGCIDISGNAFHAEKLSRGCVNTTLSPAVDSEIFIEMIGTQNIEKINELNITIGRSTDYKNAVASFHNSSPIIIYDPKWAKSATVDAYLVLGHEAGHHFCGHRPELNPIARKQAELEADRFSGASIKRFELYHGKHFLEDVLRAAIRLYPEPQSRAYPSRADRIEAIKLGYDSGSPCGKLAPGVPGFAREPR